MDNNLGKAKQITVLTMVKNAQSIKFINYSPLSILL